MTKSMMVRGTSPSMSPGDHLLNSMQASGRLWVWQTRSLRSFTRLAILHPRRLVLRFPGPACVSKPRNHWWARRVGFAIIHEQEVCGLPPNWPCDLPPTKGICRRVARFFCGRRCVVSQRRNLVMQLQGGKVTPPNGNRVWGPAWFLTQPEVPTAQPEQQSALVIE